MRTPWRDDFPVSTNPLSFWLFASKPHALWAFFSTVCMVAAAGLNAFVPYVLKQIVDAAHAFSAGDSIDLLFWSAVAYIGISLATILSWRIGAIAIMHWSTGARATARQVLSSYATLHSHSYFSDRFAGSLSGKIGHASSGMRSMTGLIMWQFVGFVVSLLTSFALAFYTSPPLAAILLCWALVVTPINIYFSKRRIPLSTAAQQAETVLSGSTVDMLSNISAVYEYARRGYELTRLKGLIEKRRVLGMRNWIYGERVLLLNGITQTIFTGSIVLGAVYLVGQGQLTAGDIVLLLTVVLMIADKITMVGNHLNEFAEIWGEIQESLEELLHEHDVADAPQAKPLHIERGEIVFNQVGFGYGDERIFDNFMLTFKAGERVGLVGRSGAGKTTLMKVLLRHYDLTEGTVTIDGQNIRDVTKESLRGAIAVVPQESMLFHRSIRENIAYGNPDASEDDIIRAAKRAQAHDFIEKLSGGYDALVGERGVKLSGGQKQRIAIARAFLKDAPILLLDEATSALDSESEVDVQRALTTLMEDRTVLAIAHRLSTLRAMDRIIVLEDGKVLEDGTHDSLLAQGGIYASLWEHQAGGFLKEEVVESSV